MIHRKKFNRHLNNSMWIKMDSYLEMIYRLHWLLLEEKLLVIMNWMNYF